MALLTAFSFLERQKNEKKDTAMELWRWTAGELARIGGGMAAGCWRQGWRCAGGHGGGIWDTINQSINVHRFYYGVAMLLNIILHRFGISPAAAMLEEVRPGSQEEVRPGSQEEGRAGTSGRRYPPSTLWGWDDIGV